MHEIKPYFSENEIHDLANKFKILSEPSRLKILRLLFGGEKCVTDIIEATGLMQANVSKQLKVLQMNNLLGCRPQGLKRYYRVTDTTVKQICDLLCNTSEIRT